MLFMVIGRASVSAALDMFITLLSMGVDGWQRIRQSRHELFGYFTSELSRVATAHGERLMATPNNPISFGRSLFVDYIFIIHH
jgi:O-phospho-L-seryl-tRNASec:L-selenocysteinyl-tRNA synthase